MGRKGLYTCFFIRKNSFLFISGETTTKQEAAELAVIHSSAYKAGTGAKVAVDTTEVKNIWKANGAKPGMVLYEVYTTVYITPREGLEEQLKKK